MSIVFQTGQTRWAGTGTARENTARARPRHAGTVPVPGTARQWAVPGPRIQPVGWHEARHGNWAGTMQPAKSPPLDDLRSVTAVGCSVCIYIYRNPNPNSSPCWALGQPSARSPAIHVTCSYSASTVTPAPRALRRRRRNLLRLRAEHLAVHVLHRPLPGHVRLRARARCGALPVPLEVRGREGRHHGQLRPPLLRPGAADGEAERAEE